MKTSITFTPSFLSYFLRRSICVIMLIFSISVYGQTRYDISSESEFYDVRDKAKAGDSIVWAAGLYKDVFMVIDVDSLTVTADGPGSVIFSGGSKVEIESNGVVLSNFQFVGGDIGSDNVIDIWGSDVLITQINIQSYESYKYLIVDEDSRRTTISYCNFEDRINLSDQNILSILVDDEPGFHKIQYCSFKNFRGNGQDMGIEPIRIGVSSQAHLDSRTIVEYCYFENCDGDGEIISNKAAQNVMRYNTFKNNTKAELVLRHGDEAIVYGNFFLDNMGGIRVREGQRHFIFNNYFSGQTRRSIYLQNESSDPLDSIHIYFNTIVNSEEVILNTSGSHPPQNVVIANNIFSNPTTVVFDSPTGDEQWIGNIAFGNLGMEATAGINNSDPQLIENQHGYFQIGAESPAIDAAASGFPLIPSYEGLEFDDLKLDLMKQSRPEEIGQNDIGATEFSTTVDVQPHVTLSNTGPSYSNDSAEKYTITTSVIGEGSVEISPNKEMYAFGDIVKLTPVPAEGYEFSKWSGDRIGRDNPKNIGVVEDLAIVAEFTLIPPPPPSPLDVEEDDTIEVYPNPTSDLIKLSLPAGFPDQFDISVHDINGKVVLSENILQAGNQLDLDVSKLPPGIYFLTFQNVEKTHRPKGKPVFRIIKD